MDAVENSIISRRTRLKKKSFPASDIHIKQEVDIQDIYCNEDQDDITEGGENFMPEIKVELLDEDTISADEAVILKQESNFNQYIDNLASADKKNQSLEASTTAQVYPFAVSQTKIEEYVNPNTRNQLNAETFSKLSCSVNLHRGINLSDIAKCKICQKLRQNQLNKPKSVDYVNDQITLNNESDLWTYRKNKYECNQCGLKFLLELNLKKHLENHFASSPSRTSDVLSNYLLKYEDHKMHSCLDDNDSTSDLDVGTEDFSQSECGPYQCNYCSLKFLNQCNFVKHIESHLKSIQLSESIFIQTDNKQYRCPYCGLQFLLKYNLNSHLKIHDRTIFKCLKCDKIFANQHALNAHCRFHFKEFYKCNFREQAFSQKNQEKIQIGETYDCKDCEKTFLSQNGLKYHSMIHLNGQKFKCIDCDKKFTTEISFKRHLQLHSKEKPYECAECGKEFALETYANRHYLRNHGRLYKCEDCDKSFSQYDLLKVHAQIHHKKKLYECSQCDRKFVCKFILARHSKTHMAASSC